MKVNYSLLPIKSHYFFLFAATAPLIPFLPVYANQNLSLSYSGIGLVYTILPFVGLLAKTFSGALADWKNAHRKIFLTSIVICGLGFISIYFVPSMPTKSNIEKAAIQFDCSTPNSYLRHHINKNKCGKDNDLSKFKENITTTCELSCDIEDKQQRSLCNYWKIPEQQCIDNKLEATIFFHLNHFVDDKIEVFFPVTNLTFKKKEIRQPSCHPRIHLRKCLVKCDNDQLMEFLDAPNYLPYSEYADILATSQFWLFLICISIAWSGLAILVVMSDTICFQLLGANASKYGTQRMFGSIGWGILVILAGLLIDYFSPDGGLSIYTSSFILCGAIISFDFLVATRLKVEGADKGKSNFRAIGQLFCNPRIDLFILCCIIVGISTGVLWTYQLILVENVAFKWDCEFNHLKLLQGLIIGVSCFGGELPFFFLSGKIISFLGHVHAMSVVVAAFGLRFILYYTVSNPWLFLPIELLNGFTFGIFYTVMTSYANIVAPAGSQATMQGIVGASFEGLGVAAGGFIGGALFSKVGESSTFLIVGIVNLCCAFCHFGGQMLITKFVPSSVHNSPRHDGYMSPTDSLRPVASAEEEPLGDDNHQ